MDFMSAYLLLINNSCKYKHLFKFECLIQETIKNGNKYNGTLLNRKVLFNQSPNLNTFILNEKMMAIFKIYSLHLFKKQRKKSTISNLRIQASF